MNKARREEEAIGALKGELERGKGIDIGTMFIKCAQKEGDEIGFRSQRNAFFEVEHTDFTKKILDNSKVKYIVKEDKLYVVGDEALQFANMFNKETRRPLSRGVISPTEKEALPMVELLIKSVVGEPTYKGEIVYFSIPGEPLDADFNIIYHIKMLEGFLKTLGYTPKSINEGHAIILSELAEEDFTGIGLSFGGGMVNVCLSFMSVPVFKFSVTKAGDWIDQQVAMAVDETASRVSAIKESSLDLSKEEGLSKIESALSIYYNHLIEYVIENIKQEFSKARRLPRITKTISIILSGGTSLPKGFSHRFKQILDQLKLPVPVGSVKMASQPLRSVAKGALVAASADESKSKWK
jgi:actin-like ATPase involved in cell morphogenesis